MRPETPTLLVGSQNHDVALENSRRTQPSERVLDELSCDSLTLSVRANRQVVQKPPPSIVSDEHRAGQFATRDCDQAQPGIAHEEGRELLRRVGITHAHTVARPPKRKGPRNVFLRHGVNLHAGRTHACLLSLRQLPREGRPRFAAAKATQCPLKRTTAPRGRVHRRCALQRSCATSQVRFSDFDGLHRADANGCGPRLNQGQAVRLPGTLLRMSLNWAYATNSWSGILCKLSGGGSAFMLNAPLQAVSSPPSRLHVNYVLHVFQVSTARNITLALDEETLREARVLAAQRGLSVSAFLRSELAGLVERQRGYARARDAAIRRLRRGQSLGGGKLSSREDLHDRAKLR